MYDVGIDESEGTIATRLVAGDASREGRDVLVGRRALLFGLGAAALTAACGRPVWLPSPRPAPSELRDPFTLGVASGEPSPDGVVLWTRLAPDPLHGGGMPNRPVPVRWQVAADEAFRQVVSHGVELARPELGHSVHAEPRGLHPDSWYWYRFRAGANVSPVGRTRTTPVIGASMARVAFTTASCQSYATGYYTAHHHMADEDLNFVVHLGDYIYEGPPDPTDLRPHEGDGEPATLDEYRNRHAQYRSDEDLQACHAAFPWLVVLDDHEIANGWADDIPHDPKVLTTAAFRAKRAAALRAYYEHMPLRRSSLPRGVDIQLYRRALFGDLLDVHLLDTRQYRSDQNQQRRLDPSRTILGDQQERWLLTNLAGPTARWNALAQQVFFSQLDLDSGPAQRFNNDSWDNYVAERDALRDHIAAVGVPNPVILTGDVHATYVCDVKADFADPRSATVATELVGTSISSFGDGADTVPGDQSQLAKNPHIRFINRRRGYLRHIVTPETWITDIRVVDHVTKPASPITTRASFAIEHRHPGAVPT
jgi:alkaline phosphatase D